jgi:hypothetical protein
MSKDRTTRVWRVGLLLLLGLADVVIAQEELPENPLVNGRAPLSEPGIAFNAGVLYSDNVRRTPDEQVGGGVGTVGTTVNLVRTGTRLNYDLIGNLQWAHYFDNAYPNKLLGFFDGNALFGIVPHYFEWVAQESINQLTADPFAAPTPQDTSTVSYFTTGPRGYVRFGMTTLILSGEYGKTQTSSASAAPGVGNVALDSNRYTGTATLRRVLSSVNFVSLTGSLERVRFNNESETDYDRSRAYLSYDATSARTHVSMSAGYVHLHALANGIDQQANRTPGGPTARFDAKRRISSTSSIFVLASQEVADALDLSRTDIRTSVDGPTTVRIARSAPVRDRALSVGWYYKRGRNELLTDVRWTEEHSDTDTQFNRTVESGEFKYQRRLWPVLNLRLYGTYDHERYDVAGIVTREIDWGAALTYKPRRAYAVAFRYDHYNRSSSVLSGRFRETRIGVTFIYHVL